MTTGLLLGCIEILKEERIDMNSRNKMTYRAFGVLLSVMMVFTGMFSPFAGNLLSFAGASDPKTIEIKGNPSDTAVGEKLTAIAKDENGNVVENAVFIWRYDEYEEDEFGDGDYLPTGYIAETGNTYTVPSMLGGAPANGNKISVWAGPSASNKTAGPIELRIVDRDPVDYDAQGGTASDEDILKEVKGKYDLGVLQPTFGKDTNIKTFLEGDIAKKGYEGVTVTVDSSTDEDTIAADGTINYFYKDIDTEAGAMNKYSQVTVNFTLHKGSEELALEKKVNVFWDVDKLKADLKKYLIDSVTEDTIRGENASLSQVTENMFLPAKISGKTYGELKWESNNTDVISLKEKGYSWDDDYGYEATVKKPATDTDVVLTVYVNKYNFTNVSTEDTAVKTVKKTFTVTVKADDVSGKTAAMRADLDQFDTSKITNFNLKGVADLSAVKDDLQLPAGRKSGIGNYGNYKLEYLSSDESVIKVNGYRTFTYRPGYGEEPKSANLIVKITDKTNSNLYVTKEIPVTVVAVSDAELDEEYNMLLKVKAAYFDAIKNANESKDAITTDLHPFKEGNLDESGNATFVYNVNKMTSCGIVPDDIPGYDPMGSAQWRTFKSSRPDIIAPETLLVTQPQYDTEVTLESVLTSERFKAMAEANPTNEKLARLYKQPVSITLTVKGTDGPNPNAGAAAKIVKAIVSFYDGQTRQNLFGYKEFEATSGLAKSYGYDSTGVISNAATNEVTMLDMLVAITAESLGLQGGPTAENIEAVKDCLAVNSYGYISKAFGTESSWISMLIDGIMPNDGTFNDSYGEYNLVGVDGAVIAAGQLLNYFFYQDANYPSKDCYGFFEKDGNKVSEITVPQDETIKLTLKGYNVAYSSKKAEKIAENTRALDGMQLAIIEDGTYNFKDVEGAVTDANGQASLSFAEKGTYILSAKTTDKNPLVPPYLKVTVTEGISTADRQTLVDADKEALTFNDFKGANTAIDSIESNLNLVKVGNSGKTKITWTSSVPATIAADGTVARPLSTEGSKEVKLTATISYGTVTATREFTLTVTPLAESGTVLEALIAKLPETLSPTEWNEQGDAKEDTNIITMVQNLVKKENASVTVLDTCTPSAEQTQIAADGTITYGDSAVRNKEVTFSLKLGEVIKEYIAKVTVAARKATKEEAFKGDWLTFDTIKKNNDSINNVTTDLSLPKEDDEGYYTKMEWTSSNEDVIKIDSYATNNKFGAKVTRPAAGQPDAVVTLTAKIMPGDYWAYGMAPVGPTPDPNYGTKQFVVTVKAASADEAAEAQALVDEAIKIFNLDMVTVRGTKDKADMTALKYHYNDFPMNWNYAKKLEGFKDEYKDKITISWASENPGITNVTSGTVVRTDKDQAGDIVLTLTCNGATAVKKFPTKVLAFTAAEAKTENDLLKQIADSLDFDAIKFENAAQYDVKSHLKSFEGAKVENGTVTFDKSKVYHTPGAQISWESSEPSIISKAYVSGTGYVLKVTQPEKNTKVTLTATLDSSRFSGVTGVNKVTKDITVYVTGTNDTPLTAMPPEDIPAPAKDNLADAKKLAKGIYDFYAAKDNGWWGKTASFWHATGVNAYEKTNGLGSGISAEAKQAFVNNQIYSAENLGKNVSTNASTLAKAIISLSAFGYDPSNVLSVNKTKIDIPAKEKAIAFEDASKGYYASVAPYVLLALNEGNFNSDELKAKNIAYIAANVASNYQWGPDTPAMMIQGIAPYYGKDEEATKTIDAFVTKMSEIQKADGTFGNANTNAMVVVALCELGINPDTDPRFVKNGNSALAGLLSQQTTTGDPGFLYGTKWNEMATNQGLIALVSAINTMESGKAYNVFDFSAGTKAQAMATSNVKDDKEPASPKSDDEITVYMTVKGLKGTWLPKTEVKVKADATCYHAFTKALDAAGFSYVGAKKGYVSSITNAKGESLAEFDEGKNSGWLYKVNGTLPTVGLNQYALSDKDNIVWYYVKDWTKDPDAVANAGGSSAVAKWAEQTAEKQTEVVANTSETKTEKVAVEAKTDSTGKAEAKVGTDEVKKAVESLAKDSAKDAEKNLELKVKTDKDAKEISAKIDKDSVKELKGSVDKVAVSTDLGEITLDKKTLEQAAGEKADLSVEISKNDVLKEKNYSEEAKKAIEEKVGDRPVYEIGVKAGDKALTNLSGKMEVALPYDKKAAENPNAIVVNAIDENGNMTVVKDCYFDEKTGEINFTAEKPAVFAVTYEEKKFEDTKDHWAKDYATFLAARDIVQGKDANTYAPNDNITKAEFVAMIGRMSDDTLPESSEVTGQMGDVKGTDWFAPYFAWAVKFGILTGDESGNMRPNELISRQDMSVIIDRYAKHVNKVLKVKNKAENFADKASISNYAKSSVEKMQKAGILNGKPGANGTAAFDPAGKATRGEVSKVICLVIKE